MSQTYQDIKDNTSGWCKNLKNNGIYTEKDYTECLGFFKDLSIGELPPDMDKPKSRLENSFGIYNRDNDYLEKRLVDSKSGLVTIITPNGLSLAANSDGTVYLNPKDSDSNQDDQIWRMVI